MHHTIRNPSRKYSKHHNLGDSVCKIGEKYLRFTSLPISQERVDREDDLVDLCLGLQGLLLELELVDETSQEALLGDGVLGGVAVPNSCQAIQNTIALKTQLKYIWICQSFY